MNGGPNYEGLNRLCNQIKANLSSVTSDPGAVASVRATQQETVTMRDWKRSLELHKEIALVRKTIKNQIVEVIDKIYVKI